MKKIMYVVWLLLALGSGLLIAILNSKLLLLPLLLGGAGLTAVIILLAVFIVALYKVWSGRRMWSTTGTYEKNI